MKRISRWQLWVVLGVLLLAVIGVVTPLLHSKSPLKAHASGTVTGPSIKVSRTIVHSGMPITVTGTGFSQQVNLTIYFDSTNSLYAFTAHSDNQGNFSQQIQLPYDIAEGPHLLLAQEALRPYITAKTRILFKPYVAPVAGKPGLSVTISGLSFGANETVSLYWGEDKSGQLEGTATADASGNIGDTTFTVPQNLDPGSYPVAIVRTNQKPARVVTYVKVIPATLTVTTPGIRNNQIVTAKITGFLPNEYVYLSWDANGGQSITDFYTDAKGNATNTFSVTGIATGAYTLTASDGTFQATTDINVGAGIVVQGQFGANYPNYGGPGQTITVYGSGLTSGETFNVYFQSTANGSVSATADSTGTFSVQLQVPNSYNPATRYYVYAVSTTSKTHAKARFYFMKPTLEVDDWYGYGANQARYNDNIAVSGSSFAIGENVNIIWNYGQTGQFTIATLQADFQGNFGITIQTPSVPNQSEVVVEAVGTTSNVVKAVKVENDANIIWDSPDTLIPGSVATFSGGSFGSNDSIEVLLEGKVAATTTSASDGTFTTTFPIPNPPPASMNDVLEMRDTSANISVSQEIYYSPQLTASASTVSIGSTLTVTGKFFRPNEVLTLTWETYHVDPIYIGTVTADANGSFTYTFQVQGIPANTYNLAAFGSVDAAGTGTIIVTS